MDEEHKADLEAEVKRADVIVMIYSVDSLDSISHIYTDWLPRVRQLLGDRSKVPPPIIYFYYYGTNLSHLALSFLLRWVNHNELVCGI